MALTSLQVCMDSDWLQGTIHEDGTGMDSSSSPSGDMLGACSSRGPLMERRLRPPHDHALKCPRCDSTHTKFCYYNNYSLSQPRYFCKTCRRYWTKGGTLRNIPVGGGCRKNKKVSSSSKKSGNANGPDNVSLGSPADVISPDHHHNHGNSLQLTSFPQQMASFSNHHQFGTSMLGNPSFMLPESHYPIMPIDFMVGGFEDNNVNNPNFQSPFSMYLDSGNQHQNQHSHQNLGLMMPYETDHHGLMMEVKPNAKNLLLEWNDLHHHQHHHDHHEQQQQNLVGKDHSYDYFNVGSSSWSGLMNGYGASAANPLV